MKDWNVVVTVPDRFSRHRAQRGLKAFGEVATTPFHNVLVMRVADTEAFLAALADLMGRDMTLLNDISRLMPAQATFDFETQEGFEASARAIILGWAHRIYGKRFHIRLHRRGMADKISSSTEEKVLDTAVLEHLAEKGHPGRISFDDPDCVIDVETVENRAGLSLWDRMQLERFPFFRVGLKPKSLHPSA